MDFWNTVKGNQLADVLIQCLPELTKEKTQHIEKFQDEQKALEYIDERLMDGEKLIQVFQLDYTICIVMEK